MNCLYRLVNNFISVVLVVFLLTACSNGIVEKEDKSLEVSSQTNVTTIVEQKQIASPVTYIDARVFIDQSAIGQTKSVEDEALYHGGIVPHHDVAMTLIDEFYSKLSKDPIDGIILIGPDHKGIGSKCSLGTTAFMTYEGLVELDPIGEMLLSEGSINSAPKQLQVEEHSIGLHMNYIAHYFPDVPVVPIYLQDRIGLEGARAVIELLETSIRDKHYLVIGSVDFSHNLSFDEAQKKDEEMQSLILDEKYQKIFTLKDAYIDSSATLFISLELMKHLGLDNKVFINHDNSAHILKLPAMKMTTSYYTIGCK